MLKHSIALCSIAGLALASVHAQDSMPPAPTDEATPHAETPIERFVQPARDARQTFTEEPAEEPAPIAPPIESEPDPLDSPAPLSDEIVIIEQPAPLDAAAPGSGSNVKEFQGDDVGQVLRLLARQAGVNLVVSEKVVGTVTMRLEDKAPLDAIRVISNAKGLIIDEMDGVYYVKTQEEKTKEPAQSAHYTFNYAIAEKVLPLLAAQLQSKIAPQVDSRTNTIFYREGVSNMEQIALFLETIDTPTKQVMIEARLVEVTANPRQSYGINWGGLVGSSSTPQTIRYGGSPFPDPETGVYELTADETGRFGLFDFLRFGESSPNSVPGGLIGGIPAQLGNALTGQFAILSVPQFSLTLRMLNEDADAEFLANPRVVTANNQKATIKIIRNQPVPQLNFNEQTATAVFGGFEDKEFGNTLVVTPSINKDEFVTLSVQPEISNKVGDATFTFAGATVASPIIDKRSLESNVLIKSGDTLAIGGLLQDEVTKGRTKVPILGDIPIIGYAFQERLNTRTKRNLLVFVTPTIIKQGYGTGLEDQVGGIHHSGEEYADPNGWRNNAKGAVRLVPTSHRQLAADYPKPGTPLPPQRADVRYKRSIFSREK